MRLISRTLIFIFYLLSFIYSESHAEPVPELAFHFLPSLSCGSGEVLGVLVEHLGGFVFLAFIEQVLSFLLYSRNLVKGFVFKTHGVAQKNGFGATPLHSGEFVSLAVMPNPGLLAIAKLTAFIAK